MSSTNGKKRSLILAGGGVKVAFQAGVLQVWLDEAGLEFDHVDGASGGVFNLAMMCQGMTGTQMAENWRNMNPKGGISFNWKDYAKLFYAESLFTLDNYRKHVFPQWGLDWQRINASSLDATFNTYNFSKHELEVLTPSQMTEDHLVSCVSLPMWFPPVKIDGDTYIDSVFITDANIEEAIRRGVDELWIIWTVSEKGEWHDGFVANYFQIIETSANGHFKRILRRVEENNAAYERSQAGEFGRRIEIKLLKAEVALHYLINFSQDRLAEVVNAGVQHARRWCDQHEIPYQPSDSEYPTDVHRAQTRLSFVEEMKGYVTLGETDYDRGYRRGRKDGTYLMFQLTIKVEGVNRFVASPMHEAAAEGFIRCDAFGGQLPVERGIFNLFVDDGDPASKRMLYRLFFMGELNGQPQPLTLSGHKRIKDDPGFDLWTDTTTLFTRILKGHVGPEEEERAEIMASGVVVIQFFDFLKQLTTFRAEGPTFSDRASALSRFGKLFMGKLWDVYARETLTTAPF